MQAASLSISKHPAGSLRELISVSLPLIISAGSDQLLYVWDRICLARHSELELAAVLPAAMLHWTMVSLAYGMIAYVNAFVGQYEGAGRRDRVAQVVWQGIYLAIVIGLALLLAASFASRVFAWFDHAESVRELEVSYFKILSWGGTPLLLSVALSSFFSGRGETKVLLWASVITCSACAIVESILVFGAGPVPELGIRGAAYAHLMAFVLKPLIFLFVIYWRRYEAYQIWQNRGFQPELLRRLVRFGSAAGMQMIADVVCFALFTLLVGKFGNQAMMSTTLAINFNGTTYVPILGIGIAVTAITGHRIGERRPQLAVPTVYKAFYISSAWIFAWGIMYFAAPDVLLRAYLPEDSVQGEQQLALLASVRPLLKFIAIYSLFDAMNVIFSSATRGAGDTRFAMKFSLFGGLVVMVLPTYLFAIYAPNDWGFLGAWWSITISIVMLGLGFLWRFRQGKWMSMRVIENRAEKTAPKPVEA